MADTDKLKTLIGPHMAGAFAMSHCPYFRDIVDERKRLEEAIVRKRLNDLELQNVTIMHDQLSFSKTSEKIVASILKNPLA